MAIGRARVLHIVVVLRALLHRADLRVTIVIARVLLADALARARRNKPGGPNVVH